MTVVRWLGARSSRAALARTCRAAGAATIYLGILAACSSSIPEGFEGGWRRLTDADVTVVVRPDGTAEVTGQLAPERQCESGPSGWVEGSGTWSSVSDTALVVRNDAGANIVVSGHKFIDGTVDWTSLEVGLCGTHSGDGQWVNLVGGASVESNE